MVEISRHKAKRALEEIGGIKLPDCTVLSIWTIGVAIMFALTVKYLRPICNNYFDPQENVAVKIGVIRNGSLAPYPPLYICVPNLGLMKSRYTKSLTDGLRQMWHIEANNCANCPYTCLLCNGLARNSWDVWKTFNDSLVREFRNFTLFGQNKEQSTERFEMILFDAVMKRLFANASDFSNDHTLWDDVEEQQRNVSWQFTIVEHLMHFYELLYARDYAMFRGSLLSNESKEHPMQNVRDSILNVPDETVDRLFEIAIDFWCFYYQPSVFNNISDCTQHVRKFGTPLFDQQYSRYCVTLPFERDSYSFQSRAFVLALTKAKELRQTDGIPNSAMNIDSTYANEIEPDPTFAIRTENPVLRAWNSVPKLYESSGIKDATEEKVTVRYSLQSKVLEQRDEISDHCYKDRSKSDCLIRCQNEIVENECGCSPFSTRYLRDFSAKPYCNVSRYLQCNERVQQEFKNCESACTYACNYDFYQWQVLHQVIDRPVYDTETLLSIYVDRVVAPYMEFSVISKDGAEDLISSIGGLFNFYLGMSGLTLVFIFVYFLECFRRWRRSKEQATTPAAQPSTATFPIGLHWRWWLKLITAASPNAQQGDQDTKLEALQKQIESLIQENADMKSRVEAMESKKTRRRASKLKEAMNNNIPTTAPVTKL